MVDYKPAKKPHEPSMGGAVSAPAPAPLRAAVTLTTRRLTLRPPAQRDLPSLVALANNPMIARNLNRMPHPYTRADGEYWIDTLARPDVLHHTFAITDRYRDIFIGGCGYRAVVGCSDHVALGYWLGEPFWGQGFAAEAAQAVIDLAFEIEKIDAVELSIRASNHQSRRVAEKCGFQFSRHGMAALSAGTGMVSVDHYMMTKRTWESLHAWGHR